MEENILSCKHQPRSAAVELKITMVTYKNFMIVFKWFVNLTFLMVFKPEAERIWFPITIYVYFVYFNIFWFRFTIYNIPSDNTFSVDAEIKLCFDAKDSTCLKEYSILSNVKMQYEACNNGISSPIGGKNLLTYYMYLL